ncbi:phage tail protein [Bartonella sp. B12(2025)]
MSKKVADAKVKLTLEDKITAPLKRVQNRFKELSHGLGVPRFSAAVTKMTASLKGVQSALGTAASRTAVFSGALGIAGGGLVASLSAVTMKTMHMGDSLYHASRHLGMSVAALQLWGDAADNSGTSAELFQQSLAVLNRRSAQAYAGQRRGIMGFEALGISVKDASGKLKSNLVLLEEITDKMSQMHNQAQRQHIAALLFGGDGKEMASMLSQGMEKIKSLFADARKGKWMIGADVARYAADLSDKFGAFKSQLGGVASFIGARFMPVMNDLIDAFSALIDDNRALIQTTVTRWAKTLKQVLKDLRDPASDLRKNIANITERIKGWFKWMEPLIGEITLLKVGLVALGSFIFGPLIASLAALGAAFVTLGFAIMTTPVGWIIGGIALLVGAGYLLYKNWDKINGWLVTSIAVISAVFIRLTIALIGSLLPVLTAVGSAFIGLSVTLGRLLLSALVAVDSAFMRFVATLGRSLLSSLAAVGSAFVSLGITIMTTPVGWIIGGIALLVGAGYLLYKNWDTVTSYLSKLWDSFAALCSDVFDNLFTLFKNFSPLYWIAKKINSLIDWLFGVNLMDSGANLIEGLWDGMKSVWQMMSDWLGGAVKKLTSWMPSWMQQKLGFSATINKNSTETIKNLTEETSTRAKKIADAAVVTNSTPKQRTSNLIDATKIKAKAVNTFDPIMVRKPAKVDASITIGNLNISGGSGSPSDINAAVNQALERHARQQRLAIASSFSD